jgi:hypothetical protein
MSKRTRRLAKFVRMDKDKNGKPIPIYRITTVEKSKLMHEIETGKKTIKKVKM